MGSIKVINNKVYICNSDGSLWEDEVFVVNKVEPQSFWVVENILYFHNNDGYHCFLYLTEGLQICGEIGVASGSIQNGFAFCNFDMNIQDGKWIWKCGLLDLKTQKILKKYSLLENHSFANIWNNYFILTQKNDLVLVDKTIGETIWQFKLFEHFKYDRTWGDGEFYHFVGVWNDILWIDINESHLIGVDIQTGLLKYDFCTPTKVFGNPTKPYHERLYGKLYSNIDKERNLLFGFNYDTYWEINLNDPTTPLYLYIFEEECSKYNCFLSLQMYCLDRQKLYYVDAFNGTVASIDRDTKEFQFLYQFPEASAGTLMEIQVSEDKVYILDNQSTLHIFEKEQA